MLICRSLFRTGARSLSRSRIAPVTRFRLYSTNPSGASASTSSPIEDDIQKLTLSTSIHDIRTHYHKLVTKLKALGKLDSLPTRKILNETQLYKILWLLARSSRPSDVQMLHEILLDMPLVFGLTLTEDTHAAIIRGLIHRGDVRVARRWLERMSELPGHITPTLELYHMLLKALPDMQACTLKIMRNIVKVMRVVGCSPTHETFEILWINRWKQYDRGDHIIRPNTTIEIFNDMEREGLPHSASFSALIFQEYNKRGFPGYARHARNIYDERFSALGASSSPAHGEMDLELTQTVRSKGIRSAIALLKSRKPDGTSTPKQIGALLRHSRQLSDLRLVEQEFGVNCDVTHWSRIITNNTRAGHIREALSIYDESKLAGIIPDTIMANTLIHNLCHAEFSPSTDANIERALSIYQDLCSAVPPEENHADHPSSPDQDTYSALLRGLATVKNHYKYVGAAKKIMDDMAARDVTNEDSHTTTSIITLLMRNATNTEEALEIYRRFKSTLDDGGYAVVLNAFCKLRFNSTMTIPSLKGYFEIVRDMRTAGFRTTVEVYTILLHQLGTLATEVRQQDNSPDAGLALDNLTRTVRRTHDLLTLDASLSPDAILWNQMINTYQRLGCFADAYRIWETLYISGQFNNASVSSMLDACAYANAYSIARRIVDKLKKDDYRFTSHNWNTWLECLCRAGKLDEAIRVLCGEDENSPQGVRFDAENVRLVLKFARGVGKEGDVLRQVKEKSPELWDSLPLYVQKFI